LRTILPQHKQNGELRKVGLGLSKATPH